MEICHRCDNPPCCNPNHLFAGTHDENMRDMVKKGRSQHGENHSSRKLNGHQVIEIRQMYAGGGWYIPNSPIALA